MSRRRPSQPLSAFYLAELRDHIAATAAHHAGNDLTSESALCGSVLPPGAYWTVQEKNAFFHGLSAHSRLRPDLIAQEIGTKSLFDVLVFLDALDEGSCEVGRKKTRWDAGMESIEVSDAWVKEEMKLAEAVAQGEEDWLFPASSARVLARAGLEDVPSSACSPEDQALLALDKSYFRALDTILREEGDMNDDPETDPPSGQESVKTPPNRGDNLADPALVSSTEMNATALSQPTWDVLPSLASSSQPDFGDSLDPSSLPHISQQVDELAFATQSTHNLPDISLAFAHSQSQPSTPPPPVKPTQSESADEMADPALLTPRSRRRQQKRLHMRRKRALLRGEGAEDAIEHVRPLKRGRKAGTSTAPSQTASPDTSIATGKRKRDSEASSDEEGSDDHATSSDEDGDDEDGTYELGRAKKKKKSSGPRGKKKALNILATAGIDTDVLRTRGLDLFYYSNLGKASRNFSSEEGSSTTFKLGWATAEELAARVRAYTERLVRAALVQASTHADRKEHTRVWRRRAAADEVDAEDVERAVGCVGVDMDIWTDGEGEEDEGAEDTGTEEAEKELGGDDGSDGQADDESDEEDSSDGTSTASDGSDAFIPPSKDSPIAPPLPSLSTWRMICQPLLHVPEEFSSVADEDEVAEAWLMEAEAFDEAEESELSDEEDADEQSALLFETAEQALWAELDAEKRAALKEAEAKSNGERKRNRKGKVVVGDRRTPAATDEVGGALKVLKSAEFIEDSE